MGLGFSIRLVLSHAALGCAGMCFGFWLQPIMPLGDSRWAMATVGVVCVAVLLLAPELGRQFKTLVNRPEVVFDMPVLRAIRHVIASSPHSYTWSDAAERAAFLQLYTMMCQGALRVAGAEGGEFAPLRRIRPRKCRQLEPRECILRSSPAAPDGVAYILSPPLDQVPEEPVAIEDTGGFRNLRVPSHDVYKMWPRIAEPA